jgi:nitroreductase
MQNEIKLIDFLRDRHSTPVAQITEPGPSQEDLEEMLAFAIRVPDHGKIAPWRLVVYRGEVRESLGREFLKLALQKDPDLPEAARQAELVRFARAPLVVAVVSTAAPHAKIPEWEQVLSAGALAFNLVLAAHAHGYVANWRTEWVAYDDAALQVLGIKPGEKVAGFIHIGSSNFPTPDRPRPELSQVVTYAGEA